MTYKKRTKKANQETQMERVKELTNMLEEGVRNFSYDPDHFKALLKMKALMPSYSFRNILLAMGQMEHASFIAPFKKWNELGRKVIKGEKALRILAPRFKKVEPDCSQEDVVEPSEGEVEVCGFIAVPVFDVSQTEPISDDQGGLPIDELKPVLKGESEQAADIVNMAEWIAKNDQCPVTYGNAGTANGFYQPSLHRIVVSDRLSGNHRAKTLVHELVHSKVHRYSNVSKEEREVVAEGCAFVICSYFDLDTSDYSFRYVKSWSKSDDALLTYGSQICDVAKTIIQEFEEAKVILSSDELVSA
ncbi:ArdC-like ssDNA-binding domain-containing protein [Priestia koreensis]|uniref:ArdC-like ssDNA-binding domain-containing protein n=1 Tax=Priestia koreensis TaxID=284581 RepID=UPI00203F8D22|nr:ArdC-like ssDNA-binding domain-containing protein [Priestia koreensis]MCM3005830.1 ArdC-like ssDNA-binding domain-containing protein [Priestia koreensis]